MQSILSLVNPKDITVGPIMINGNCVIDANTARAVGVALYPGGKVTIKDTNTVFENNATNEIHAYFVKDSEHVLSGNIAIIADEQH